MPAETAPSIVEALQGLKDIVSGARQLVVAVAARLPGELEPVEIDAPIGGTVLLSSCLRCIVRDRLDPAILDLTTLLEELLRQFPPSETEA